MKTSSPIAMISPSSLSGSLWTEEAGASVHYDAYLSRDRKSLLIVKWILDDLGAPISEERKTQGLREACNDPAQSEEFIWFVRGFLGIPTKYGAE